MCCPKDRELVNACDWPKLKLDSAMALVRDVIRRQGFIDRAENAWAQLTVALEQRDRAVAECTVAVAELGEARAVLRDLEQTASELKVQEDGLIQERDEAVAERDEAVADLKAAKKALESADAEKVALERLQKETSALVSQAEAERDAARVDLQDKARLLDRSEADAARRERALLRRVEELKEEHAAELARSRHLQSTLDAAELASVKAALEEKSKQLERAEVDAAGRDRALRGEMEELKKAHATDLDRVRRLRFEELAAEPECQETLVEQMVDVFRRGFEQCKGVVAERFPQVDLRDIRPDDL